MDPINRNIAVAGIAAIVVFTAFVIGFTILDQETEGETVSLEPQHIEADVPRNVPTITDWLYNGIWSQRIYAVVEQTTEPKDIFELRMDLEIPHIMGSFRYMKIEYTIPDDTKLLIWEWIDNGYMQKWIGVNDPVTRHNWTVTYNLDRGNMFEDYTHTLHGNIWWSEEIGTDNLFQVTCTLGVAKDGAINEYVEHFTYHLNVIDNVE